MLPSTLDHCPYGGGDILREFATGTGRNDLCVRYGGRHYPIEIKILHSNQTIPDGLQQLAGYMDKLGENTGHLVIFDRRPDRTWNDKIFRKTETYQEKNIEIRGC